ncbi:response to stress [Ascochyta rabiei]|uniref:Response to stress n=1 Tax=Didymella rabiei TaxID=5454 RepID=A0A163KMB1_DIDRA|nr:response to stress [Ascochyta rabiei]
MALSLLTRALDRNGIDPDSIKVNTTDPMEITMSRKYCQVGTCPEAWQTIAYRPNMTSNVIELMWKYTATMSVGILGEMIGYVGRVMMNVNPFLMNNFLVNMIPLTIAPALVTAGIYLSAFAW